MDFVIIQFLWYLNHPKMARIKNRTISVSNNENSIYDIREKWSRRRINLFMFFNRKSNDNNNRPKQRYAL